MHEQNDVTTRPLGATRRWRHLVAAVALVCLPLTACGGASSDGAADSGASSDATAPGGSDDAASPDADGSGDARGGFAEGEEPWKQDDVQLRARLTGLKSALEAERVEVDGNTVHVYFPDGEPLTAETSWCDIADVTLPDGYSVVTHWEGKETAC